VVAGLVLALVVYTMALSQTLAALVALGAGSLVFWWVALPPKRRVLAVVPLLVAALGAVAVPALRHRLEHKLVEVRHGHWNDLFSGRFDGFNAALGMAREHPWLGVGNGGYGSSFAPTKLALAAQGVAFWSRGSSAHFENAHNDYLEALAEWGILGALATLAAILVLARELRRFPRDPAPSERAFAVGGSAALAVLALASFPLRIALIGYPWLLFLAWIFAQAPRDDDALGGAESAEDFRHQRVVVPARALAVGMAVLLLPAVVVHARSLAARLQASKIVRTTSQVAQLAMQSGPDAARPVLRANLAPLERAARFDPLAVKVPLTTAGHHLLLGDTAAAIDDYQRGLAVEPRAELYINLARALVMAGRHEEAVARARDAVTLDPATADDAVALGLRAPDPTESLERERRDRGGRHRRGGRNHDSEGDSDRGP